MQVKNLITFFHRNSLQDRVNILFHCYVFNFPHVFSYSMKVPLFLIFLYAYYAFFFHSVNPLSFRKTSKPWHWFISFYKDPWNNRLRLIQRVTTSMWCLICKNLNLSLIKRVTVFVFVWFSLTISSRLDAWLILIFWIFLWQIRLDCK